MHAQVKRWDGDKAKRSDWSVHHLGGFGLFL